MSDDIKRIQLFLLPFAGGSSVSFNKLFPLLDTRIEPITIEYAGRATRRKEPFIMNYYDFISDVAEHINEYRSNLPYSVLGYSLGSAVVYDLLSRRMIKGFPTHAFICARGSLLNNLSSQSFVGLPDNDFIFMMSKLGGIDERILKNKRFLDIYLRPIRADYIIWGQYKYQQGSIPCSATAIYSPEDEAAKGVKDWSKIVDGTVDYYEMGENHFFLNNHWRDVAEIINTHLEKKI